MTKGVLCTPVLPAVAHLSVAFGDSSPKLGEPVVFSRKLLQELKVAEQFFAYHSKVA